MAMQEARERLQYEQDALKQSNEAQRAVDLMVRLTDRCVRLNPMRSALRAWSNVVHVEREADSREALQQFKLRLMQSVDNFEQLKTAFTELQGRHELNLHALEQKETVLREQETACQSLLQELESTQATLRASTDRQTEEQAQHAQKCIDLTRIHADLQNTIDELRAQLKATQTQRQVLMEQFERREEEVAQLQVSLALKQEDCENITEFMHENVDKLNRQHAIETAAQQHVIASLQAQILTMNQSHDALTTSLQSQIETMVEQLAHQQHLVSHLQANQDDLESRMAALQSTVTETLQDRANIQFALEEMTEANRTLKLAFEAANLEWTAESARYRQLLHESSEREAANKHRIQSLESAFSEQSAAMEAKEQELLSKTRDHSIERRHMVRQYEQLCEQEQRTVSLLRTHQEELEIERANVAEMRVKYEATYASLTAQIEVRLGSVLCANFACCVSDRLD